MTVEGQRGALSGWGRHPVVVARHRRSENLEAITRGATLSRGLGRSYGDASLPGTIDGTLAVTTAADRLCWFDAERGIVRAEAGVSLATLNRVFWPRGWSVPSSPGTQQVTLGGMVAADVHGKSHHSEGCFGEHVRAVRMRVADERILEVSEDEEPELFRATLGGMGLTGHLLEVEFQLRPLPSGWVLAESQGYGALESTVEARRSAGSEWPHTLAWIDLLAGGSAFGRGVVERGRRADPGEAPSRLPAPRFPPAVPFVFPLISGTTMRLANIARYWSRRLYRRGIVHPDAFFYPLDVVGWLNRLYPRAGFTQYQVVLPTSAGVEGCRRVFDIMVQRGAVPLLCVLKDFGGEGKGMLSFPKAGLSIAVDLPITDRTQVAVDAMNDFVAGVGGRVYLAKDTLTRPEHFRAMEPRLPAWQAVRRHWDPEARIRSALSVRLFGDPT